MKMYFKPKKKALADYLLALEKTDRVKIFVERLSRFKPVLFDEDIVKLVEKYAKQHGLKCRRITSGAGQDAQNMTLLCPTAMIFLRVSKGSATIRRNTRAMKI